MCLTHFPEMSLAQNHRALIQNSNKRKQKVKKIKNYDSKTEVSIL